MKLAVAELPLQNSIGPPPQEAPIPNPFPAPPPGWWSAPFAELARACGLEPNIESQFKKMERFVGSFAR